MVHICAEREGREREEGREGGGREGGMGRVRRHCMFAHEHLKHIHVRTLNSTTILKLINYFYRHKLDVVSVMW